MAVTIQVECRHTDPPHIHEFPDDWIFGGADSLHFGADPRWKPSVYEYISQNGQRVWVTSSPLCDDEALDQFTWVAGLGPSFNPKWVIVRRPDGSSEMLPWEYNKMEDLLTPREVAK